MAAVTPRSLKRRRDRATPPDAAPAVRVEPVLTSRDLAKWKYGWAKGWPEVWSYPRKPRAIPAPEGRAQITASTFRLVEPPGKRRAALEEQLVEVEKKLAEPGHGKLTRKGLEGHRAGLVRQLLPRPVTKWEERHTERRAVCENLRRAAWYVRRHWNRDGDVWADGPYKGMPVIDPADRFEAVNDCCKEACVRPTTGGKHGNVAVFARRCKDERLCPVCAAEDGRLHAERVRVVAGRTGRPGELVHLVLTHRDQEPSARESCIAAWERHERAWQRLRTGKNGQWWASRVYGFAMRLETTNGATGLTWHPHSHTIVELQPGVTVEQFRNELAARWARCTALAAIDAGLVDFEEILGRHRAHHPGQRAFARECAMREVESRVGWDRASGWDAKNQRERWCETIRDDGESIRSAAYQAAKYANPCLSTESPARLAEWLQWAAGRKLTRWGGVWQGVEADWESGQDAIPVREWIDAQVEYDAQEKHREEVGKGNRPDVGELIPGAQETVGLSDIAQSRERGLERVQFDQLCCSRDVQAVDDVRAWWHMLAEQRTALWKLRRIVKSRTDEASLLPALQAVEESLQRMRLRPVDEGLAEWRAAQAEWDRVERAFRELTRDED